MKRALLVAILLIVNAVTGAIAHPGSGIVVDRRGYVYFVDTGSGAWVIDPGGKLARYGGPAFHWMALEESDRPSGTRLPTIPHGELVPVGVNPVLLLSSDAPIVVGEDGALYYPKAVNDGPLRIMRFTRAGAETVRATLPSKAQGKPLRWLNGLATGSKGSLYFTADNTVGRTDERGSVSTLVEGIKVSDCAKIPGIDTGTEPYLRGLAVAPDGTVFVAASGCGAVLKITPRSEVSTVLRTSPPWSPTAVATSPSGLYVLEYLHTGGEDRQAWLPRVRKILPDGTIVDVAAVQRSKGEVAPKLLRDFERDRRVTVIPSGALE